MDDIFQTKIKYSSKIYYKNGWGIFKVRNMSNGVLSDEDDTLIIKGLWTDIDKNKEYYFIGKEIDDEKYGKQYDIYYIGDSFSIPDNEDAFLKEILSPSQLKNFYDKFDNPLSIIESKDIDKMTSVEGIGEKTAAKILDKYKKNKSHQPILAILGNVGISNSLMWRIFNRYKGDVSRTISTIMQNPYKLIDDVRGIGWETADSIACKIGIGHDDVGSLVSVLSVRDRMLNQSNLNVFHNQQQFL